MISPNKFSLYQNRKNLLKIPERIYFFMFRPFFRSFILLSFLFGGGHAYSQRRPIFSYQSTKLQREVDVFYDVSKPDVSFDDIPLVELDWRLSLMRIANFAEDDSYSFSDKEVSFIKIMQDCLRKIAVVEDGQSINFLLRVKTIWYGELKIIFDFIKQPKFLKILVNVHGNNSKAPAYLGECFGALFASYPPHHKRRPVLYWGPFILYFSLYYASHLSSAWNNGPRRLYHGYRASGSFDKMLCTNEDIDDPCVDYCVDYLNYLHGKVTAYPCNEFAHSPWKYPCPNDTGDQRCDEQGCPYKHSDDEIEKQLDAPSSEDFKLFGFDNYARRKWTQSDLKRLASAYKKLSRKMHPDKNLDDTEANDKFTAMKSSYDRLLTWMTKKVSA
jgi:hypothetical protein